MAAVEQGTADVATPPVEDEPSAGLERGDAVGAGARQRPPRHLRGAVGGDDVGDRERELVQELRIGLRELEGDGAGAIVGKDVLRKVAGPAGAAAAAVG